MSEFITLACPSCGGQLTLERTTKSYTCQYCGQTHLLRNEDIESFLRCPICGRNDKVERVSAISINDTLYGSLAKRLSKPVNPRLYPNSRFPVTEFIEPALPVERKLPIGGRNIFLFILGLMFLGFTVAAIVEVINAAFFRSGTKVGIEGLIIILPPAIIGLFLVTRNRKKALMDVAKENAERLDDWKSRVISAKRDWEKTNAESFTAYENSISRWNQLCYCHRDGVIFVPNENTYSTLENYEEYLYQQAEG